MKSYLRQILLSAFVLFFISVDAQKKSATIQGKIMDENDAPLANVSVIILGQQKGIVTNDSGSFRLKVPADKAFALVFTYSGFKTVQQNFLLNEGEEEMISLQMETGATELDEVVVRDNRERREVGLIKPNPKSVINLPSPISGVESLIKIFVGSNNELTSQYNVRGGSYDENLVYVNDFEIFRPYLVRSGQQEGLSFINPALVRNINFYNGGFQAHYGDKMSSVLDIQYNKPKKSAGSAYIGILEQGAHVEGVDSNNRLSYLIGVRNRSNRNLLSSQDAQGSYVPSSSDLQALISYQVSNKWQADVLGNISRTKFTFLPEFSQLTSSVFSPYYTQNLGVDIYFEGRERDAYSTTMAGLSTTYQANKNLRLKWLASRFENDEEENIDITGDYSFGDRDFDKSKPTFGQIVNPLGRGLFQTYARNSLNIVDYNFSHKGSLNKDKHLFQWGVGYDKTLIKDKLDEWEYQDSAGYSLPYNPGLLQLSKVTRSSADLDINKFNGYVQDNMAFGDTASTFTVQAGLRFNYNDLNKEFLLSPRVSASWKPNWQRDIILRQRQVLIINRLFTAR